jgi:hypothetical protein
MGSERSIHEIARIGWTTTAGTKYRRSLLSRIAKGLEFLTEEERVRQRPMGQMIGVAGVDFFSSILQSLATLVVIRLYN